MKEKKIIGFCGVRFFFGEGEGGNSIFLVDIFFWSCFRFWCSRCWFCFVEIDVIEFWWLLLYSDIIEFCWFLLFSDIMEFWWWIGDMWLELWIFVLLELVDWFCFDIFWEFRGFRKNFFLRSLYWDFVLDLVNEVLSWMIKFGVFWLFFLLFDKFFFGFRRCGIFRFLIGVDVWRCLFLIRVFIIKLRNFYYLLIFWGKLYFFICLFFWFEM